MIECIDAGNIPYLRALEWQQLLAEKRRKKEIPDTLLLLEHPPVYTYGKRDSSSDLLVSEEWIREKGMDIVKTDRGGRITYHGPGQLVGYLIFELKDPVPSFVHEIEEVLIQLLMHYHIEGERDPEHPGIWVANQKIAALGLHISKGVTTHGFSLNVHCDLKPFRYIHPCGIRDRGVTSIEKEAQWSPSIKEVKHYLLEAVAGVFKTDVVAGGTLSGLSE